MKLTITTELSCTAERAWEEVQQSRLLIHVAAPIISFRAIQSEGFPTIWQEGRYAAQMKLFGIIPLGKQDVVIEYPITNDGSFQVRDNGQGTIAKRWDHRIIIQSLPAGNAQYTDSIEVEAGVLTPFVAAFAWIFYRHRQKRWRELARNGFVYFFNKEMKLYAKKLRRIPQNLN